MKKIIFVALAIITVASCKPKNGNVWTKEYEEKNYETLYKALESSIGNPDQRKKFAKYTIQNLKKRLPSGLESVSADSLKKLSSNIGEEYASKGNLNSPMAWSPTMETSFKQGMMREVAKSIPSEAAQEKFCDCLIFKLKQINRDSLMLPLSDTLMARLGKNCLGSK